MHNNGGDVNHRRQRRQLVVYQPQTEPIVPDVRQPRRTASASEGSPLAGVGQHAQRSETSQGHGHAFGEPCSPRGPQRRRDPQRNSPTAVVIFEHPPHVGGFHGGPFQCCFAVVGCVSTEHVRPGMWREFARQ